MTKPLIHKIAAVALAGVSPVAMAIVAVDGAEAQVATTSFDIPAQSAPEALEAFGSQSGKGIMFDRDKIGTRPLKAVQGNYAPDEALRRLVAGTGLEMRVLNANTFVVEARGELAGNEASDGGRATKIAASDEYQSNDIIVTAQRREQKLQDVPFGISAFGTENIDKLGLKGAADYLALVPGVSYNNFGRGRSSINIRGVNTEGTGPTGSKVPIGQGTTEIYLDDLPVTDRFGSWITIDPDTFDLERIEVLRGPQGTLFGSGAIGGALRLVTNKPNLENLEAKIELGAEATQYGDDGNTIRAMVNVPIIEGKLALRIAASRQTVGGYIDGVITNEKDYNSEKIQSVRAILEYRPIEPLTIQLTGILAKQRINGTVTSFRLPQNGGSYEYDPATPEYATGNDKLFSGSINYDFGGVNLTSVTTYMDRNAIGLNDWVRLLGGDVNTGIAFRTQDSTKLSQEVRLASSGDGPFEWTVGGFYLRNKQQTQQVWRLDATTYLKDDTVFGKIVEQAVFGEATYHLNDQLSFTAGARYNHAQTKFSAMSTPGSNPILTNNLALRTSTNNAFTPKASVSFHPRENLHLYATVSRGNRVGQVNYIAGFDPRIPQSYQPDSLWNYEAGIKSSFFDKRLMINIAAYHIDWTDIQLSTLLYVNSVAVFATNHVANAGDAKINGIEAEIVAHPIDAVEFGSSMAYTEGRLVRANQSIQLGGVANNARLPGSPKFAMTNYLELEHPISDDVMGRIRFTHQYVGKMIGSLQSVRTFGDTGSWTKFDIRGGVSWGDYDLSLYVDNVVNSDAIIQAGGTGFAFTNYNQNPVTRLRPRTIGLTFRADFK